METQQFDDSRPVQVVLQVRKPVQLVTRRAGVITGPLDAPDELVSGSVAFTLDLRPIVAVHTGTPLFRDLTVGDQGGDVEALNAELTRLGYGDLPADVFTSRTADAWSKLLRASGSDASSGGLRIADILWLPAVVVTLDAWMVSPGTSVAVGDVIAGARPRVHGATLRNVTEEPMLPGSRTLVVLGLSAVLGDTTVRLPDALLARLEATPGFAELLSAGVPYEASGELSLTTPVEALRVPPGALFAVNGRRACIQVADRALPVEVVGSGLGATLIILENPKPIAEVAFAEGITKAGCR